MTATTLLQTTVPLVDEIDPNTVKPGWVALLIILALAAAVALLMKNMSKQLKRIEFDPIAGQPTRSDGAADDPAPSGDRPAEGSSPAPAGAAEPTTTDPTPPVQDAKPAGEPKH